MNCIDYINKMNHGVVVILGSGKTFKSGTLYSLLEYCPDFRNRRKAFYKFPAVYDLFPSELLGYSVNKLNDIEPDSICIIEDANRVFPSRSSKSPVLQEFLGIISHKDILIFLTVQNTANTDLAFFRDQDVVFLHKKMNETGLQNEREEISMKCKWANQVIDEVSCSYNISPHYVSYASDFGQALILNHPPSWYGYEQSHALRNYLISEEEAKHKGAA